MNREQKSKLFDLISDYEDAGRIMTECSRVDCDCAWSWNYTAGEIVKYVDSLVMDGPVPRGIDSQIEAKATGVPHCTSDADLKRPMDKS